MRVLHPLIRLHPVIALALADVIALLGTRLSMIAIPWLVLTMTGDPILTGLVGFAATQPYILAKALGGPLIDRFGGRNISIIGDLASMLTATLVPLLFFLGTLHFEILFPVIILLSALRGPADAAKQSMVPAVAAITILPIERVTGVMGTISRLAGAIGAAAAGALVTFVGPAPAVLFTACTSGLAAGIVAVCLRVPRAAGVNGQVKSSYVAEISEGWRFFSNDPVLVSIVIMLAITNLLDQAYTAVLLPIWVKDVGSAALLGALLATFSAASVLGSVMATWLAPRLPRLIVYAVAFLTCGAPRYLVFVFDTPITAIFIVLASAGYAAGFILPIISAVTFERIPSALLGRVNSLTSALAWALIPFGGLFGGVLITTYGLSTAFAISAGAYFAAALLPLALPSFRAIAQRPR